MLLQPAGNGIGVQVYSHKSEHHGNSRTSPCSESILYRVV